MGQWLGFVIDTIRMQFGVPSKKIAKLENNLNFIISSRTVTFRDLTRVDGFINSLFLAVGPIARLFIRQIHSTIQARCGWDCSFLVLCWRRCVFGFLISRPLTVTGFSRSSAPEQLFSAMPATTLLVVSKLGSTISLLVACLLCLRASKVRLSGSSKPFSMLFKRMLFR